MAPRALRWHLYGFASLAKVEYQHTFHIMVPVVFDDRVLWTKALVPTNALQRILVWSKIVSRGEFVKKIS